MPEATGAYAAGAGEPGHQEDRGPDGEGTGPAQLLQELRRGLQQ